LAAAPAATAATAAGLTVAVLGRNITLPDGRTVRSLGALARALQTNSLNNILSTPTLLTLDNYQAKIVVGQNVPFVTGSFAQATAAAAAAGGTTGAVVNPFQTIERRDVGLTLRIKPQISEGGAIRLEIFQEVSRIDLTSQGVASDVVTTKRSLETKVVVDDGNTIVLGGLIDDTKKETQEAIPLLGSIPILGALFRFKQEVRVRTNLMIFLRPVIVRTAEDGYRVTSDRYDYLRAYTRGEGEEREALFDRMEPVAPVPPGEPPARVPGQDSPAAPPAKQPDAEASSPQTKP